MSLTFLSVCDGMGCAQLAFGPLGWQQVLSSEIDAAPRSVLAHHLGAHDVRRAGRDGRVALWGDFSALRVRHLDRMGVGLPDVLCGGTPCQDFSVAGLRAGLSGARGNLTLHFIRLADAIDAARRARGLAGLIIFWENVPGVLSHKENPFGNVLAAMVGEDAAIAPAGGKWSDAGLAVGPARAAAWRTLDSQYFGLAQRRERVFVVASARDGFDPAAVLLEWEGLRRDSPPSREAGQVVAGTIGASSGDWSRDNIGESVIPFDTTQITSASNYSRPAPGDPCHPLAAGAHPPAIAFARQSDAGGQVHAGGQLAVCVTGDRTHALTAEGFDASEDGTGRGPPIVAQAVAFALRGREGGAMPEVEGDGGTVGTLRAAEGGSSRDYVATAAFTVSVNSGGFAWESEIAATLGTQEGTNQQSGVRVGAAVRRLTPQECCRLQGVPADYFDGVLHRGKPLADGPIYKMLGNGWSIPVIAWIGRRIEAEACRAMQQAAA